MKGVTKALTTKLGPLPRWGWAALAVVGYVLYRRRQAQTATAAQDQTQQSYGAATTNPDLYYVPGGSLPIDPSAGGSGGGNSPGDGTIAQPTPTPTPPAPNPGSNPASNAPAKRKSKPKPQHKPKKKPAPKTKHPPKPKARSHATTPTFREKRNTGKPAPKGLSRTNKVKSGPSKLLNRTKTSVMSRNVQSTQRPEAKHPVAHPPPHATNPPRPSAPPKRAQRTRRK